LTEVERPIVKKIKQFAHAFKMPLKTAEGKIDDFLGINKLLRTEIDSRRKVIITKRKTKTVVFCSI